VRNSLGRKGGEKDPENEGKGKKFYLYHSIEKEKSFLTLCGLDDASFHR